MRSCDCRGSWIMSGWRYCIMPRHPPRTCVTRGRTDAAVWRCAVNAELNAAEMLDRAETATGLSEYGDPTLPARFGGTVGHLNDIGMDEDGRRSAIDVCHGLLTSRL